MGSVQGFPRRSAGIAASFLLALGASCSSATDGNPEGVGPDKPTTSATTSTTAAPPQLDPVDLYVPLEGEPVPELKSLAARAIEAVGTYERGGGSVDAALARMSPEVDPALVDDATPLLVAEAASSTEVVYPQLGGLTQDAASVMVVFRWQLLLDGEVSAQVRTADVRLARTAAGWRATEITSLGGEPADATAPLSSSAEAVLANDRIGLPDSARWDILAGRIDDPVLDAMLTIATDHTFSVAVLASGHPLNVFDTASVSNHTEGRGVDIWAIDGIPVVSQRSHGSAAWSIVQALVDAGVTEIGSPWDLDGPGGASFTNTVHQDHLHVAFDGMSPARHRTTTRCRSIS